MATTDLKTNPPVAFQVPLYDPTNNDPFNPDNYGRYELSEVLTLRHSVDSIDDLRLTSGVAGASVNVAGYYTPGDGGGGPLRIWGTAGGYVDNGGSVIVPTGGDGSGAWVWEHSGPVNVKWFGAKGDGVIIGTVVSGTDDTTSFVAALATGTDVNVPSPLNDCYIVSPDQLVVGGLSGVSGSLIRFYGYSKDASAETYPRIVMKNGTSGTLIRLERGVIEGLSVMSVGDAEYQTAGNIGIEIGDNSTGSAKNFDNCTIRDIRMDGFYYQIYSEYECDTLVIEKITSIGSKVGHSQIYLHCNADQTSGSAGLSIRECHLDAGASPAGYGLYGLNLGGVDFAHLKNIISNDHNTADYYFGGVNIGTNVLLTGCHSECNNAASTTPIAVQIDGKATYVALDTCNFSTGAVAGVTYSPVLDIKNTARVVAINTLFTGIQGATIGGSATLASTCSLTAVSCTFSGDFTKDGTAKFINMNSAVTDDTVGDVGSSSVNGGGLTGLSAATSDNYYLGNTLASKPRITFGSAAPSAVTGAGYMYFREGSAGQIWAYDGTAGEWVGLNFAPTTVRRGPMKQAADVGAAPTTDEIRNALRTAGIMA